MIREYLGALLVGLAYATLGYFVWVGWKARRR